MTWIAVTGVLLAILLSYQLSRVLTQAAANDFPQSVVLTLLALTSAGYSTLVVPIGFFLAIMLGLGRLYHESEMAAMQACEVRATTDLEPTMFTAGHGSRSADELVSMLSEAGVGAVADVRRFPHSRRHPQHDGRALAASLAAAGIRYEWLGEGLGGRVPETLPPGRSPNGAWREPAFRRYADYMASAPFERGERRRSLRKRCAAQRRRPLETRAGARSESFRCARARRRRRSARARPRTGRDGRAW